LAAKQQKAGKQQRGYTADPPQHTHDFFGIGLDERTGGPQQQEKRHYSEQECRHDYFSCSISLATPTAYITLCKLLLTKTNSAAMFVERLTLPRSLEPSIRSFVQTLVEAGDCNDDG